MVCSSRLTRKYQITIPTPIRKALSIKAGDWVYMDMTKEGVVVRALPHSFTEDMAGLGKEIWKGLGGAEEFVEKERISWEE